MKQPTNEVIDELLRDISASLEEAWEEADDESIMELTFNIIDSNKTAILADVLQDWKESKLTKEEFLDQLNYYCDYLKALSVFVTGVKIAAEQIIPD